MIGGLSIHAQGDYAAEDAKAYGSRILAGFSPRVRELYERPQAQLFGLFVFIAIFFMTPIGGLFFEFGWRGAAALVDIAGSLVGNPSVGKVI